RAGFQGFIRTDRRSHRRAPREHDVIPPLSFYVHLPWCVRKCPYCDFNSHTVGGAADTKRYVNALVKDIQLEGARAGGRVVESVFFGGGTPSYFDAGEIGCLVEA